MNALHASNGTQCEKNANLSKLEKKLQMTVNRIDICNM